MVETRSGSNTIAPPLGEEEQEMDIDQLGEQIASPNPRNDAMQEDPEQEYELLRGQVIAKRRQDAVEAMRLELAGGEPVNPVVIEGLPMHHKRAASSAPADAPPANRYFRPATLPSFEGKNLKEVSEYESGWKIYLEAAPPTTDAQRIHYAATYLRGSARDSWTRKTVEINTWEEYIAWCRTLVADPANRMAYSSLRLKTVQQKENQTVRDLVNYIEELEKDIPAQTEQEKKAWQLLNSLAPAIRREVMKENKTITSRDQVIAAAQRQEELAGPRGKDKKPEQEKPAPLKVSARGAQPSRGRFQRSE
jgi:hypothetical protein